MAMSTTFLLWLPCAIRLRSEHCEETSPLKEAVSRPRRRRLTARRHRERSVDQCGVQVARATALRTRLEVTTAFTRTPQNWK